MPVVIKNKNIQPVSGSNVFNAFIEKNEGKMMWMDLIPVSKSKWSENMYAYYYSTVLPVATDFLIDQGWDVSQEEADDMLISMFSAKNIVNHATGEIKTVDHTKSRQTFDQGVTFINRVIRVLAENNYVVPEADKNWREPSRKKVSMKKFEKK